MDLRVLHTAAHLSTWYGQFGFDFGRGAYNITREQVRMFWAGLGAARLSICHVGVGLHRPILTVGLCFSTLVETLLPWGTWYLLPGSCGVVWRSTPSHLCDGLQWAEAARAVHAAPLRSLVDDFHGVDDAVVDIVQRYGVRQKGEDGVRQMGPLPSR